MQFIQINRQGTKRKPEPNQKMLPGMPGMQILHTFRIPGCAPSVCKTYNWGFCCIIMLQHASLVAAKKTDSTLLHQPLKYPLLPNTFMQHNSVTQTPASGITDIQIRSNSQRWSQTISKVHRRSLCSLCAPQQAVQGGNQGLLWILHCKPLWRKISHDAMHDLSLLLSGKLSHKMAYMRHCCLTLWHCFL